MPDIFDQISLEETQKKDIFDDITVETAPTQTLRHLGRSASRIGESLGGLPADILKTAQLGAKGLEKGANVIRERIGLPPRESSLKESPPIGSEDLKGFSQKLFGSAVIPQSKNEKLADDILSDAAVLAIPVKGRIPFLRSIGGALAGNLAKEGAEQLGAGEKGQTMAKLGGFFLAALTGKGNVKKFWNEQYKLADEAIPKGAKLNASDLNNKLNKLDRVLSKGGIETSSQKFVQKPVNELKKIIHNDKLRVDDAVAAKKKINEIRSVLFDEVKGKSAQKYARTKINDISSYLDDALESYGKKNPTFYQHYKAGNEAFGGYQQSRRVGRWISRHIPLGRLGKTSLLLLEALFKPATLPITAGAYTGLKSAELVTRMLKNPTLRKYYTNVMKSAVEENRAGFLREIKNLDKAVNEIEPDLFDVLAGEKNANKNSQ